MNGNGRAPGPYMRPMQGWWRRNPCFLRYMVRELTAVAVLVYAIVLMLGVVALGLGEAAWVAFTAALRSPWSIALHLVLLAAMFVHAKSWFEIMPKTLPMMFIGGKRLSAAAITTAGWAAAIVFSIVVFALAWWAR